MDKRIQPRDYFGEIILQNETGQPNADFVSAGSLRVARRFLADFFGDQSLPESPVELCRESCDRFRKLAWHYKAIRAESSHDVVSIVDHVVELCSNAVKCVDNPMDFIRYIHKNAEDLGVTRRDLIDNALWRAFAREEGKRT